MGFSVGGDCIGWDEAADQYKLTLTDKQPGYLALTDVTVNGTNYAKGDVLTYESKHFLNNNAAELSALEGKVYALPSEYDAILEFTRLGVPTDKQADVGINGYGVSPSTTQNRTARFTSGTDCPFLIEYFSQAQSFKGILGDALGMAVPAQYREYVGGSTYTKDGTEYLKVIGETYDGEVYTGQLHVENGTPVVGEAATASEGSGLFIPANTKGKNYDAAVKFVTWAAGPEGQKILAKGNRMVPNQTAFGMNEYADSADRLIPNMWAGAYMAQEADIGDYTYFTSLTWITEWSIDDPRLFSEKEPVTDYAYSFAVLPDTQILVENDATKNETNTAKMIDWIIANKESKNIQQVLGLGDITDNNNEAEWTLAKEQFAKLDAAGISYSLVRGNHDQSWYRKDKDAENYTTDDYTVYMGTEAYRAQFDGFYSEDNIANSWKAMQIGNIKYLLITLDYGAKDAVLNWASDIIYQHPDHNVIITTHAYLYRDGTTLDEGDTVPPTTSGGTNNGDHMWDKLISKHENIVLVMSGHDPCENIVVNRSAGDNGNIVTSMLIDAQDVEAQEGSMGMVAMLYFSEDGKTVQVEYYSTSKEKYFKSVNQFTLELNVVEAAESSEVPATGAYTNVALTEGSTYTTTIADEQRVTLSDMPHTLSAWIHVPTSTTKSAGAILGNYIDNDTANCLNIEIHTNGNPRFYFRNAGNWSNSLVFDKVDVRSDTQWVHLVLVASGNRVSCYVNGELKQTLVAESTIQLEDTRSDLVIGGDLRDGNARAFTGRILHLDLYSGILSAEKIQSLYENGTEAVTEGKIEY